MAVDIADEIMKNQKMTVIKNKPVIQTLEVMGKQGGVLIRWTQAGGADSYIIRRSTLKEGDYKKVAKVSADAFEYTDKSYPGEGLYWYKVVACLETPSDGTLKKGSPVRSINISTIEAPTTTKIGSKDNNSVTFSWDGGDEVDKYQILKRLSFMTGPVAIDCVDKNTKTYTDTNVTHGALVYYSAQGVIENDNEKRYSNLGKELCYVCLDEVKITGVKRKAFKKVVIQAMLTGGADGYILYKSTSENGEYKEIARTNDISAFVFTDKGNKGEKGAYYKAACYKKSDSGEFTGPSGKAVFVKYR